MRCLTPLTLSTILLLAPTLVLSRQTSDAPAYKPPGKLIDIGGYRLHINCTGEGSPAVILVAGGGDFSFDWSLAQPGLSRFTRVCSYDRAGLAWSDLGPVPRTMLQDAYELRRLLTGAGVKPPYILAGHSIGGLIARVYFQQYPQEVAGMVLIDPTHEDTTLMLNGKVVRIRDHAKGVAVPSTQTMKSSPPKPPTDDDIKQQELNRQAFGPPKIEAPFDKLPSDAQGMRLWALSNPKLFAATENFWADELQTIYDASMKTKHPLGDRPLIVVLPSSKGESQPPPGVAPEEWKRIANEKREQKLGLANLSRNSKVILAEKSGHHIQLDEPEVVVNAIRLAVEAVLHHKKLGP